tara:strand:- start:926 stop:1909 length:984 start_codon:yes stop_codon:yes gene_type:complete
MKYNLVFSVGDCSNLKYYIPMIQHARKKNLTYAFDIKLGWNKWCSVSVKENYLWTTELMEDANIPLFEKGKDTADVRVCNEGRWNPDVKEKNTVIYSLTSLTDWTYSYFKYIDSIDYCVFPSRYFTDFIKDESQIILGTGGEATRAVVKKTDESVMKNQHKNLYLGSPKYDCEITFDKDRILKKYNIPDDKYALFMYPRHYEVHKTNYKPVLEKLKSEGYKIIAKTRPKDPFKNVSSESGVLIDHYLYNPGFWPHPTLELMKISDVIVNTDSSAVKEAVMLNKKVVNVKSKTYPVLEALYEEGAREKYLWTHNACDKILEHMQQYFN